MKLMRNLILCLCLGLSSLFSPISVMAESEWVKEDGSWYAVSEGEKLKGWYKDSSNSWYLLDYSNGTMRTGWVASGSDWYYLNPANGIMQTGWQTINGNKYYLLTSSAKAGAMVTGKQTIDGKNYNFDDKGIYQGVSNTGLPRYSGYENLDKKIDEILAEIIKPNMSERDQLKAIHDWVCNNIRYAQSYHDSDNLGKLADGLQEVYSSYVYPVNKSKDFYSITMATLEDGKAVCDNYSYVFNTLADALGFTTCVVEGKYDGNGHTVSAVWLNDKWVMVDTQLDDYKDDGSILYIGFLINFGENLFKPTFYFDASESDAYWIQRVKKGDHSLIKDYDMVKELEMNKEYYYTK